MRKRGDISFCLWASMSTYLKPVQHKILEQKAITNPVRIKIDTCRSSGEKKEKRESVMYRVRDKCFDKVVRRVSPCLSIGSLTLRYLPQMFLDARQLGIHWLLVHGLHRLLAQRAPVARKAAE